MELLFRLLYNLQFDNIDNNDATENTSDIFRGGYLNNDNLDFLNSETSNLIFLIMFIRHKITIFMLFNIYNYGWFY